MKNMSTIKKVSNQLNISIDTLRYYDKIGLLSPIRGENKYRNYSQNDILKLQYVSVMKYAGFSLNEIEIMVKLLDHESSKNCQKQAITLLQQKQEEIQTAIYNYSNLLKLLTESIHISENIESYPEEHSQIDKFIQRIFADIHSKNR